MSGESQRWLQDNPLPPVHTPSPSRSPRLRIEGGELSPPHGHLSLAGIPDEELRKSMQLDKVLERQLRSVPVAEGLRPRLHAFVDALQD
jgi:hypothetical protein